MSRKKRAPKRIFYADAKFQSLVLSKFINFIMYDGKKAVAEKIVYNALDQIKSKTKEDPIKIFNDAVNNIRSVVVVFPASMCAMIPIFLYFSKL